MSRGIVVIRACLMLWAAVSGTTGCSNEGNSLQRPMERRSDDVGLRSESLEPGVQDALRIRKDFVRNRLWVLTLDDVRVYDLAQNRLIRRIGLPARSVVASACKPDLALDPSGSAYVASNAHPVIWRIASDSFELKEYEISLQEKESWAVGFGALGFDADGTLFALTSVGNSLWAIDLARSSARMVDVYQPPLERCTLVSRFDELRNGRQVNEVRAIEPSSSAIDR